jgi:uncharacterized protein YdeI (BOF family)
LVPGSIVYFLQGDFGQWAAHLPASAAGHRLSFPCTVTSLEVFTAAHAPYALVSLTAVPDHELGAAPAVVASPRPTTFQYNFKSLSNTDSSSACLFLPKSIEETVLPSFAEQELQMVDIKGQPWSFTHRRTDGLRGDWRKFKGAKAAEKEDEVYLLRREDDQLFIELRKTRDSVQATTERRDAPPLHIAGEIAITDELAKNHKEFTATYYPHKGLGKFVVPPQDVEDAMSIQWVAGMKVRLRKDVVQHTTDPLYTSKHLTGTVKDVKDSVWHGLEVK